MICPDISCLCSNYMNRAQLLYVLTCHFCALNIVALMDIQEFLNGSLINSEI